MAESEAQVRYVQVSNAKLCYLESGMGESVILVHGGLGDHRQWTSLITKLVKEFRVIAYSRRNAFPNKWSATDTENLVQTNAEDLSAVIEETGAAPAHVIAESYGAFVALFCAAAKPSIFRTLVVDEPPILKLLAQVESARQMLGDFVVSTLEPCLSLVEAGELEKASRLMVNYLEGSESAFDSLPDRTRSQLMQNARAFGDELRTLFTDFSLERLQKVTCPVLLLSSERITPELKEISNILRRALPNCESRTIPNTTHGSIIYSEDYCSAVTEFIKAHNLPASTA
jgi:non-heme chloroperoxidase